MSGRSTVRSNGRARRARVVLVVLTLVASVLGVSESAGAQAEVVVTEGQSIQAAVDAAAPGTTIFVEGNHVENVWINKDGISLIGRNGASITLPEAPLLNPCNAGGPPTLICIFPDSEMDPPDPADYLNGVSVEGLRLNSPVWDAVQALFSNEVAVRTNRIVNPGCDGVFLLFVTGFRVERNKVTRAGCAGINVVGSSQGRIHRNVARASTFDGIAVQETSRVAITRNRVTGNCHGMGIVDGPDQGFGGIFESDRPTQRIRVIGNRAHANNRSCELLGPDVNFGAAGIVVTGAHRVFLRSNAASNNISQESSVTAGGIHVTDFPNDDGSTFKASTAIEIVRNRMFGNSSGGVDADLVVVSSVAPRSVRGNRCDVGVPTQAWCD